MVMKAAGITVLHRIGNCGQVPQAYHGPVLVADDQVAILLRTAQRITQAKPTEVLVVLDEAEREERGAAADRRPYLVQGDAAVQQSAWVELHPHRRQYCTSHTD